MPATLGGTGAEVDADAARVDAGTGVGSVNGQPRAGDEAEDAARLRGNDVEGEGGGRGGQEEGLPSYDSLFLVDTPNTSDTQHQPQSQAHPDAPMQQGQVEQQQHHQHQHQHHHQHLDDSTLDFALPILDLDSNDCGVASPATNNAPAPAPASRAACTPAATPSVAAATSATSASQPPQQQPAPSRTTATEDPLNCGFRLAAEATAAEKRGDFSTARRLYANCLVQFSHALRSIPDPRSKVGPCMGISTTRRMCALVIRSAVETGARHRYPAPFVQLEQLVSEML